MALAFLHARITQIVLEEMGFSARARDVAAHANERVDDRQGNSPSEANLHAMRGVDAARRQQTREQAEAEVERLLQTAKNEILNVISGRTNTIPTFSGPVRDHGLALGMLGRALHTVQDREYHHFEPWSYASIPDALLADPNYMICHGLRDTSFVTGMGYQPRYQAGEGWSHRVGGEFTVPSSQSLLPHLSLGGEMTIGPRGSAVSEWAVGATLTWGAVPGEVRPLSARPSFGLPGGISNYQICRDFDPGPRAWLNAVARSRGFVEGIKTAAGGDWSGFVAYVPAR
jgi:hypothetical protein